MQFQVDQWMEGQVSSNMIDLLICNHDVDYEGTKAKGYASQNSERHGKKKQK